jgi:hypothetical protein
MTALTRPAIEPRLLSKAQAAAYCGLSAAGFDDWRRKGTIPAPLSGTTRWDRKALDVALDKLSGLIHHEERESAYDAWKRSQNEGPP